MPSYVPLSRSGVTSRADIPNDVMTFWVRRGLVRSIEAAAGTGRHLRFEWYEANIAAVMGQLRQFGVSIDGLLQIADTFRQAVGWAERYGLTRDDVLALWTVFNIRATVTNNHLKRKQIQAIVSREGFDREVNARLVEAAEPYPVAEEVQEIILAASDEKHGAQRVTSRIIKIWAQMPEMEFRQNLDPYLTIMKQPEPTDQRANPNPDMSYFWRVGDQWKFALGEGGPEEARCDGALATIAIDVSTVIHDAWNRPPAIKGQVQP